MKLCISIVSAFLIAYASGDEMSLTDIIKSAEEGRASAQFALATRYYDGDGVPKDRVAAYNWYKLASEQGHVEAQCCLGTMYEGAGNVVSNFVEAAKWYRKAAEQGYAEGQRRYGALRRGGMGVEKNVTEGLEWYRKAAMQGDIYAAHELGDTYLFGDDVEPNIEEAMKWYRVAAEHGDPIAKCYCREFDIGPHYPRTLPCRLGVLWVLTVYPVWWMFCLLRFLGRYILSLIPAFVGRIRMKSKITLTWWMMLLGIVPAIYDSIEDWVKVWERYPGLVLSTVFSCVALLGLRWIKQRRFLKGVYVNIIILLVYALLLSLPEIHFAIVG